MKSWYRDSGSRMAWALGLAVTVGLVGGVAAQDAPSARPTGQDAEGFGDEEPQRADRVRRGAGERGVRNALASEVEIDTSVPGVVELSLGQAVRTALIHNPQIRVAQIRRTFNRRQEIIEKSAFYPRLVAGTNFSKNRRPTTSTLDVGQAALSGVTVNPFEDFTYNAGLRGLSPFGSQYAIRLTHSKHDQRRLENVIFGFNPQTSVGVRLEVTQPLLRGAGMDYNLAGIRIAANNEDISVYQLRQAVSSIVYQVEVAYWQLSFSNKNYEAKLAAARTAQQNFLNVREAREEGRRSDADVAAAESQLTLRQVELSEAESLLKDSRDQLLLLMSNNREPSRLGFDAVRLQPVSQPDTQELFPVDDVAMIRARAFEDALQNRPEYNEIDLQLKNKRIETKVADNERLPALNAIASWEQLGLDEFFGDAYSSLGTGDYYAFSVGVELEWGIFAPGPRQRYLQKNDELRQLRVEQEQLREQIAFDVDQAVRNMRSVLSRLRALERRVELQEDLLAKERAKLELGRTTYYNINVVENDLIESQALLLRAHAEYEAAKSNFYRSTGQLLQKRRIEAAVVSGNEPDPR